MEPLIIQMRKYIQDTLEVSVHPIPWERTKDLPFFLQNVYRFSKVNILQTSFLLMVDVGTDENTPANIRKHIEAVQHKWTAEVIFVRDRITPYNRKRLISQKVPFIVPGNQMYIPMIGIDLREHFKKIKKEAPKLSPAAQVVILYVLLGQEDEIITPKITARQLGYSAMTMTRVFNEIEVANLGEFKQTGRLRNLRFTDTKKTLWEKVLPFLKNPVKHRETLYDMGMFDHFPPKAGLSALAHYSILAEPQIPVFAVTQSQWRQYRLNNKSMQISPGDTEGFEIEVWSYAPSLFAQDGVVDRLSLYLSLLDEKDDRIEAALDEMMKEMSW